MLGFLTTLFGQQSSSTLAINSLEEVVLSTPRIALPLDENSRSIQVIGRTVIEQTGSTNLAELLQQVAGVDIRRRGMAGMQADLQIRGGSFDQTLLLIDGIKLDDAQTGHHTLNLALPPEVIERIEIVKGPAARIFGQNAFTGAINIVTKSNHNHRVILGLQDGSYAQKRRQITSAFTKENSNMVAHFSQHMANGYRYNTDFKNTTAFFKGQWNPSRQPITFLATFSDRKFGANGFYALPSYTDQYEETQGSLVALTSTIDIKTWTFTPRIYWRRGQDTYLLRRYDPSFYRNLHITHKVGMSIDASNHNALGTTGLGVDVARVSIASNNLGNRNRLITTVFAEHRFVLSNNLLDLTPGIALTNYTDFGTQIFPGLDVGFTIRPHIRLFANTGYTYRIPTFTDLYYSDRTTSGNPSLKVEEALTNEIGIRINRHKKQFSLALFHRAAKNLIDYIRQDTEGLFEATNIREVTTRGIETEWISHFNWRGASHRLRLGYVYLIDDVDAADRQFSRYTINSLKHHFTASLLGNFFQNTSVNIVYKMAQRPNEEMYHVLDLSAQWRWKKVQLSLSANNIFNEVYSESNQIPMPKGNGLVGLQFAL